MARTFNTAGPCNADDHYMLAPEGRLPDLMPFIREKLYFVLHAAQQTGKTTAMRAFAARLREEGAVAVWATLEMSQGFTEVEGAERLWMSAIHDGCALVLAPSQGPPPVAPFLQEPEGNRLKAWLRAWCASIPEQPVILLLDEADVVSGPAMVSLLRQLRAGYMDRGPGKFPSSIALIGMRDLRDYLTQAKDGTPVNPGSPFNIKSASLTLRNFTIDEVRELYDQHTADTGQVFQPEAVERAFSWTQGQPYLVNALARIAVNELVPQRDQAVNAAHIDEARERLIQSRTTHLDSLAVRLRDPRVARIVAAVLTGDQPRAIDYAHDDFQYVLDLGLIRQGPDGAEPANPLYREILARELTYNVQMSLTRPRWRWQRPDGGLDFPALMAEFLRWWRENAEALSEDIPFWPEAVAHISFMGFLQRVVNGGGRVTREYAAGRGAVDLLVEYAGERFVIELKRVRPRDGLERVRESGVEQLCAYLDATGEREGWLLIFDQRPGRSWEERLWVEERELEGRRLHLRGA